jgi:hypothetical protein
VVAPPEKIHGGQLVIGFEPSRATRIFIGSIKTEPTYVDTDNKVRHRYPPWRGDDQMTMTLSSGMSAADQVRHEALGRIRRRHRATCDARRCRAGLQRVRRVV